MILVCRQIEPLWQNFVRHEAGELFENGRVVFALSWKEEAVPGWILIRENKQHETVHIHRFATEHVFQFGAGQTKEIFGERAVGVGESRHQRAASRVLRLEEKRNSLASLWRKQAEPNPLEAGFGRLGNFHITFRFKMDTILAQIDTGGEVTMNVDDR